MTNIRVFGFLVAVVILYLTYRFNRNRPGKTPLLIGVVFSILLASISLFPDAFNFLFHLLTRSRQQYYRIIILLILGVLLLLLLEIRHLFVSGFFERTLHKMVKKHAIKEFRDQYDSSRVKEIQVVIPAYNESDNLRELLGRFPETICGKSLGVLVVSDGSQDETVEAVRDHDFPVVENLSNMGGGLALQAGFEIAKSNGADVVVTMDADGQHDPGELEVLVEPVIDKRADFVVGSRQLGESYETTLLRSMGISFFNGLISLLMRHRITDCSSGYRAFTVSLLDDLTLSEPNYHTTEFLIQALNQGAVYEEAPVTISGRDHGTSKKGPDPLYGFQFFRVLVQTWWGI